VDGGGDEKEGDLEGVTVDKVFAAERDQIKLRRQQCSADLERFKDSNNKFTLQTTSENQGKTLSDALYDELAQNGKKQKEFDSGRRLDAFLKGNDYDSDAIKQDLEDHKDSNISTLFPNDSTVETMIDFLHSVDCMFCLFLSLFPF
jgi:hypothetical protein